MLHIDKIDSIPIESIQYYTIPAGEIEAEVFSLPIYSGTMDNLPSAIEAIIVTSDLQGIVKTKDENLLLGEFLADNLKIIFDLYFSEVDKKKVLVLLCGDLYTSLVKRGDSGDPSEVWEKFSSAFGNVIGIAGNHDCFENGSKNLNDIENICFLEKGIVKFKGLTIAGLSGIIGRSDKNFRMPEPEYLKALSELLVKDPDILITHLSPQIGSFQGEPKMTSLLERYSTTILFCGHSHWETNQPVFSKNGTEIINADAKVFILKNKNRA